MCFAPALISERMLLDCSIVKGVRGGVLHLFLPLFQRSRLVELSLFFTHLRASRSTPFRR